MPGASGSEEGGRMSISERLRALALDMKTVGIDLALIGHPEMARHGAELLGAASIAEEWAGEIEEISAQSAKDHIENYG